MSLPKIGQSKQASPAIGNAFSSRPALVDRIHRLIDQDKSGSLQSVFGEIASYVLELQQKSLHGEADGPAVKRRKLNEEVQRGSPSLNATWSSTLFEGVSFAVPQRKKLSLEISAKKNEGLRAVNPATKLTEFGVPWNAIEHVLCLPVPDKAQSTRNFCVFPRNGEGISATPQESGAIETIVWTAPNVNAKNESEDIPTLSASILQVLKAANAEVLEPQDVEFVSQLQQATRKGEKSYHVKAFRGSKDGFLFFLAKGIVWGFKKPLIFFSFPAIDSVSYTSVLQRTFNLNIAARPTPAAADPIEFEFSMLDQADFAGIDAYIKRHSLQDASMAEQRRAKKLNINGVKGGEDVEEDEEEEEGELQKAQREVEMQADADEDDELDENFDPGSDGESEGSGTSDEESESGEGSGGNEEYEGENLVAEELGSEAEELSDEEM